MFSDGFPLTFTRRNKLQWVTAFKRLNNNKYTVEYIQSTEFLFFLLFNYLLDLSSYNISAEIIVP